MKKFTAEIDIMPKKELLDPQGKAVENSFSNLELNGLHNVRIGKHITIQISATDKTAAETKIEKACAEFLANPVMEAYQYKINEGSET